MSAPAAARGGARLARAKRVVVKIGSALLVEKSTGRVNRAWLETLAADVAAMRARGQEVVIVSSGAIALGRRQLGLAPGKLKLEESQAAAAVGQIRLAHAWKEVLEQHDCAVAQVLLTLGDTEERRRYLNARSTLNTLLKLGAVPVINENDTVATAEIRYGDNDRLAARVAQMASADCLVLLSDVDGLYSADPVRDALAKFIPEVTAITPEIEAMAGGSASDVGSGGIGRCTWFVAKASPKTVRKQWIAGLLQPAGVLHVDAGAAKALRGGKSLLPAGVTRVEGRFDRGDAVSVRDADGAEIARGLSAYSSEDARRASGRRSQELEAILGYRGRDELIHRDDLVLT